MGFDKETVTLLIAAGVPVVTFFMNYLEHRQVGRHNLQQDTMQLLEAVMKDRDGWKARALAAEAKLDSLKPIRTKGV